MVTLGDLIAPVAVIALADSRPATRETLSAVPSDTASASEGTVLGFRAWHGSVYMDPYEVDPPRKERINLQYNITQGNKHGERHHHRV